MSKQDEYISFDMNQEWFKVNRSITLCNPNNQDDKLVFDSIEELLDFNKKIWDLKKQTEWQPIATAPFKQRIIVLSSSGQVTTMIFDDASDFKTTYAKYWIPIPPLPNGLNS